MKNPQGFRGSLGLGHSGRALRWRLPRLWEWKDLDEWRIRGAQEIAASWTKCPWVCLSPAMRGRGLGKGLAHCVCSGSFLSSARHISYSSEGGTGKREFVQWSECCLRKGPVSVSLQGLVLWGMTHTARLLSATRAEPKAGSRMSGRPTREHRPARLTSGVAEQHSRQAQLWPVPIATSTSGQSTPGRPRSTWSGALLPAGMWAAQGQRPGPSGPCLFVRHLTRAVLSAYTSNVGSQHWSLPEKLWFSTLVSGRAIIPPEIGK